MTTIARPSADEIRVLRLYADGLGSRAIGSALGFEREDVDAILTDRCHHDRRVAGEPVDEPEPPATPLNFAAPKARAAFIEPEQVPKSTTAELLEQVEEINARTRRRRGRDLTDELAARLSRGRAVLVALPEEQPPDVLPLRQWRACACDPCGFVGSAMFHPPRCREPLREVLLTMTDVT